MTELIEIIYKYNGMQIGQHTYHVLLCHHIINSMRILRYIGIFDIYM